MTKKYVEKEFAVIPNHSPLEDLHKIIFRCNTAESRGEWKGFTIQIATDYDSTYIAFFGERLETDHEYTKRTNLEAYHKTESERREKAEFERLKKKFDK